MNDILARFPRGRLVAACVVLAVAVAALVPALVLAETTLVQSLSGGTRSASVSALDLEPAAYSHSDQWTSGTITLTADDSSGTGSGWSVTVQATDLVYSGDNDGRDIPAANLVLGVPGQPVSVAGAPVDAVHGPLAGYGGSLETPRTVLRAHPGYGDGTYVQELPVTLTIPGQSRAGAYSASLIVTIADGPGE